MPRQVDAVLEAETIAPVIEPAVFAQIKFRSGIQYLTSAGYNISWNGQTWKGLGTLCGMSGISEGTELRADGIQFTLSPIDPDIIADCLADIQPLAPAYVWFGMMNAGVIVGNPYKIFGGVVDTPTISLPPLTPSITLNLETRASIMNRPSNRRYTFADQHANGYANDTGFGWVEKLNDIALRWGQA